MDLIHGAVSAIGLIVWILFVGSVLLVFRTKPYRDKVNGRVGDLLETHPEYFNKCGNYQAFADGELTYSHNRGMRYTCFTCKEDFNSNRGILYHYKEKNIVYGDCPRCLKARGVDPHSYGIYCGDNRGGI